MAVNPIKVWNGTAWEYTGPAVAAPPVKYQATEPTSPATGDVWVESDVDVATFDPSQIVRGGAYVNEAARASAITSPVTGMITYVGDTGTDSPASTIPQVQAYNGSAWQNTDGLTQIANMTFSGASTISINNVFTSAFDFYKIVLTNDFMASGNGNVYLKWRVAGVDSSASYNWGALGVDVNSTQLGNSGNNQSTGFLVSQTRNANGTFGFSMDVQNPATTSPTQVQYIFTSNNQTYNTVEGCFAGGQHSVNTAYDGFSIIAPGNLTGKLKVYGYRNA